MHHGHLPPTYSEHMQSRQCSEKEKIDELNRAKKTFINVVDVIEQELKFPSKLGMSSIFFELMKLVVSFRRIGFEPYLVKIFEKHSKAIMTCLDFESARYYKKDYFDYHACLFSIKTSLRELETRGFYKQETSVFSQSPDDRLTVEVLGSYFNHKMIYMQNSDFEVSTIEDWARGELVTLNGSSFSTITDIGMPVTKETIYDFCLKNRLSREQTSFIYYCAHQHFLGVILSFLLKPLFDFYTEKNCVPKFSEEKEIIISGSAVHPLEIMMQLTLQVKSMEDKTEVDLANIRLSIIGHSINRAVIRLD